MSAPEEPRGLRERVAEALEKAYREGFDRAARENGADEDYAHGPFWIGPFEEEADALFEGDEEPACKIAREFLPEDEWDVKDGHDLAVYGHRHQASTLVALYTRPSPTEGLAPDAVEAARYVVDTAEWISGETDEDPEAVAKIRRGAKIIHALLDRAPREPDLFPAVSSTEGAEVERLREALDEIAAMDGNNSTRGWSGDDHARCVSVARRALNQEEG